MYLCILKLKANITNKMKTILLNIITLFALNAEAQCNYDYSRLSTDSLDRGVVAVRDGNSVFLSWRTLKGDRKGEPFYIYKNGELLTKQPLTEGGTCYVDRTPMDKINVYEVRGGAANGLFTLRNDAPHGYVSVKLDKPGDGITPTGQTYTYIANDASVGDVDGDGQYEIFLKWDPSNSHDNSHDGYTGSTMIDCYRLNGQRLWRIDLGKNIRSGAHYTPFIVYDMDGDGRAELMVKTADGTCDGKGHVIGNANVDYRELRGRILEGPEYISVFNGLTGEVMDTKPYIPERGKVSAWGDDRGNRSERYLAGVGYFGRNTASAIFCRGYYTRSVIALWDWDGHELNNRWTFDTDDAQWNDYAGQGNHNLRIADVDSDGWDEITYGSMCIDHNGEGLYNTKMGHGDAIHLVPDPITDKLYIWDCHENRRDGTELRDAKTGEVVFQIKSQNDVGRAMAADIDPTNYGLEMWSSDSHGIRNMKGETVGKAEDASDPQHQNHLGMKKGRWLSINFGIWWDGDLLRELLDHETVTKYNWEKKSIDIVKRYEGILFNNGTKSNPCLAADILGDWREEVIARNEDSSELRIYTTTIPTGYRINCLMEDIPYRLSVATQNVGYNQPSEPGYYIGPDKQDYLK